MALDLKGLLGAIGSPQNAPGLLNFGASMLQNSGYSPVRRSFGETLGASFLQAQQMAQERAAQKLKEDYMRAQMEQMTAKDQPKSPFGTIAPDKFTPASLAKFQRSGNYEDLVPATDPPKVAEQPADIREYEYAKSQGYKGSYIDYQTAIRRAGASSVSVNTGDDRFGKPPSGFYRPDPSKPDVTPQPGGPGEQIPVEAAGRKALLENAQKAVKEVRALLFDKDGKPNRVNIANSTAGTPFTKGRQARQSTRVAIEAALRAATGAAAPESEVERYTDMYSPGPLDNDEAAARKLQYLEDFVVNTDKYISLGRGQSGPSGLTVYPDSKPAAAGASDDPLGLRR